MDMKVNENGVICNTFNFQIAHCAQLGRYLVASTDIKKGEIILKEHALVSGPIKGTNGICPGCYQTPSSNCRLCGWPMCGLNCPGANIHEQLECTLYRCKVEGLPQHKRQRNEDYWNRLSGCLMIVRCLLLKRIDPRKWNSLLEMETNWDRWSTSSLYSSAKLIEEFIRTEYNLSETEFSSSDILKIQAILDINAYEVQAPESNVQAVYKIASLAEHNCTPNTCKYICVDSLELTFRAATDIPKGTHISATYCDLLWPTWHRQQYLQWSKFFSCSCARCQSPSELDSQLASFVCMMCYNSTQEMALALPVFKDQDNWGDIMKEYFCTVCNARFPALECQMTFKKAEDELTELDKYASSDTVPIFEQWLSKWTVMEEIVESDETCEESHDDRNGTNESSQMEIPSRKKTETCYARTALLLHPQNSLVLDACHTLFLLYPNENCTLRQLKRKECFGIHLLKATKPLFTGISKFRGTISYEMAITKAATLVNQLEQSGLTDNLHHLAEVERNFFLYNLFLSFAKPVCSSGVQCLITKVEFVWYENRMASFKKSVKKIQPDDCITTFEVLQLLSEALELLKYEPLDRPEGKLAKTGARQFEQFASFFSELFPSLARYVQK